MVNLCAIDFSLYTDISHICYRKFSRLLCGAVTVGGTWAETGNGVGTDVETRPPLERRGV